jgi:Cu-Zn family superoxide dismutase
MEPIAEAPAEPAAVEAPAPAPAPEPPPPPAPSASAELKSIPGDAPIGTIRFEKQDAAIAISAQFTGLKAGGHAMYIHENGDCGKKGKAAGGHLNPTKSKHGGIGSPVRHAGDFGDVVADDAGAAAFASSTDSITIEAEGADSVVGKAIILYAKPDNKKGSPGAPIACGVIQLASPPEGG